MLNSQEQAKIEKLLDDELLLGAIKKVLNGSAEEEFNKAKKDLGISTNIDNEKLGELIRASVIALEFIKKGFTQLKTYKRVDENPKDNINIAR